MIIKDYLTFRKDTISCFQFIVEDKNKHFTLSANIQGHVDVLRKFYTMQYVFKKFRFSFNWYHKELVVNSPLRYELDELFDIAFKKYIRKQKLEKILDDKSI